MGPFKCPECGIWWVGLEHRCKPIQMATGTNASPMNPEVSGSSLAPWCSRCQGHHVPGMGRCMTTYSERPATYSEQARTLSPHLAREMRRRGE